jgi:hypothetical protein
VQRNRKNKLNNRKRTKERKKGKRKRERERERERKRKRKRKKERERERVRVRERKRVIERARGWVCLGVESNLRRIRKHTQLYLWERRWACGWVCLRHW